LLDGIRRALSRGGFLAAVAMRMEFKISITDEADKQLRGFSAREQRII